MRSIDGEVVRRIAFRKTWCKTESQDVVQPLSLACTRQLSWWESLWRNRRRCRACQWLSLWESWQRECVDGEGTKKRFPMQVGEALFLSRTGQGK